MLAGYNNFNQYKILERETGKLVDVLSLVKSKAQSADIYFDPSTGSDFDCSGSDEFGGYQVEVNQLDYNFKQCCRDVTTKNKTICSPIIQSYALPANVNFLPGTGIIDFNPLSGGVTLSTITLHNSLINKCLNISISETGVITPGDISTC